MIEFKFIKQDHTSYDIKLSTTCGKPVIRNRIKRLLREAIRKNLEKLKGYKVIAIAKDDDPLYKVYKLEDIEKLLLNATKNL